MSILALTASADPDVLRDIARQLHLHQPSRHVHGFYRSNLYYQVQECTDETAKQRYLLQALQQNPEGPVLVYCGTRKGAEDVASFLSQSFSRVGCYHAGLSAFDRTRNQEAYSSGDLRILVATNAFGMGAVVELETLGQSGLRSRESEPIPRLCGTAIKTFAKIFL